MQITALAGCAVVACLLIVTVKQYRPDMAVVLSIAAGVVFLAVIADALAPVLTGINTIVAGTAASGFAPTVFRALGVCLVSQIAADVCRDAGQQTLATRVETAGSIGVLVIALPLLSQVLAVSGEIING